MPGNRVFRKVFGAKRNDLTRNWTKFKNKFGLFVKG
jgi:hypothetical protein